MLMLLGQLWALIFTTAVKGALFDDSLQTIQSSAVNDDVTRHVLLDLVLGTHVECQEDATNIYVPSVVKRTWSCDGLELNVTNSQYSVDEHGILHVAPYSEHDDVIPLELACRCYITLATGRTIRNNVLLIRTELRPSHPMAEVTTFLQSFPRQRRDVVDDVMEEAKKKNCCDTLLLVYISRNRCCPIDVQFPENLAVALNICMPSNRTLSCIVTLPVKEYLNITSSQSRSTNQKPYDDDTNVNSSLPNNRKKARVLFTPERTWWYVDFMKNECVQCNRDDPDFTEPPPLKRWRRNVGSITIIESFAERTLTSGGDISFQCAATGDSPPRFVWERDGVPITSSTDPRYALGQAMSPSGSVVAQLNVSRVRVEDGGRYACRAIGPRDSTAAHVARLNIYGAPYIRALPPLKVLSGNPVELPCPYYGYPISKVEWEFKGKKITQSFSSDYRYRRYAQHLKVTNVQEILRNIKRRVKNSKSKFNKKKEFELVPELTASKNENGAKDSKARSKRESHITVNDAGVMSLEKITADQSGLYTCIVTSPSGEMARRSFEIQVTEAPDLDELLMGSNLQEGQIVQITCTIRSGDTPIYFSWLKDGIKIPASLKIDERNSELFSVLVIRKVALEHCGTYTCIAANHAAKVNRSSELYIKVSPKWIAEPANTSLLLGHEGRIACSASGYPQPQVHWLNKHAVMGTWQPVLDLVGSGILSLPNGSLVIKRVKLDDEGFYSCNVENGVGSPLTKTIWISVNKPVSFDTNAANVTTRLGHMATLSCPALGDFPVRISWTHNSKPIDFMSPRIKQSEVKSDRGVTSTLSLQYAELRDGGLYHCRASNPYGVSTFVIDLTVQEPLSPPSEVSVEQLKSRSAWVRWRGGVNGGGGNGVQHYVVQVLAAPHYNSPTTTSWEHATTINVTRSDHSSRQGVQLPDLSPATSYSVRVAAGGEAELSPYSTPLIFNTLEEAPNMPPSSVMVSQTSSPGELHVSWQPPPADARRGELLGYYVKAVPYADMNTGSEANVRSTKLSALNKNPETTLSGLLKNTRYSVTVSAYNAAGQGPYSLPSFGDTREGAPERAPGGIDCMAASSTSLRVSWKQIPLEEQGGSLLGYTVMYAGEDSPWFNTTSLHTELYLQGLLKYTNYSVKIAGYSNFGMGPFSYQVTCTTLQDVPGPPEEIKVLVHSSTSLLVSWKKPTSLNGILTHYTVYIKPSSSIGQTLSYRSSVSDGRQLSHELRSLTKNRQYESWVTASTVIGEGEPSSRVSATPSNRVVAGIWSLGGAVSAGVGGTLLLACAALGSPAPRTVWYHNHNIITHHPRYTRHRDDSLLIDNIDQSLSGNYTCLAKNLFGSDSVTYQVSVLPLPEPPVLRTSPTKDSIVVEWDEPVYTHDNRTSASHLSYEVKWRELNGAWQEARADGGRAVLESLKCGRRYSVRVTATNNIGTSPPAYADVATLGAAPVAPQNTDWLWSNSSHIFIQLSGWSDGGCEVAHWDVDYREAGTKLWLRAENKITYLDFSSGWRHVNDHYIGSMMNLLPKSFAIGDLVPAQWYQLRITARNQAGAVSSVYSYATKTIQGEEIGPPSDYFDISLTIIICSSVLLFLCILVCIYAAFKRHQHSTMMRYRDSITGDFKSDSGNLADVAQAATDKDLSNRLYSTPINVRKDNGKNEMYEISPYAQFAVGFRTFGHMENQDNPGFVKTQPSCYNTGRSLGETSFQMCSESEDSDSLSKTTTIKSVPGKMCRLPHHR